MIHPGTLQINSAFRAYQSYWFKAHFIYNYNFYPSEHGDDRINLRKRSLGKTCKVATVLMEKTIKFIHWKK
jgi:hypothetical protein